jgi:hypothetical protein
MANFKAVFYYFLKDKEGAAVERPKNIKKIGPNRPTFAKVINKFRFFSLSKGPYFNRPWSLTERFPRVGFYRGFSSHISSFHPAKFQKFSFFNLITVSL